MSVRLAAPLGCAVTSAVAQASVLPGLVRRHLVVTGVVQGVGFRPYVWRLAREHALNGWTRNNATGLEVLVEGPQEAVQGFTRRLPLELPPLARVGQLQWEDQAPRGDLAGFAILASQVGSALGTMVGADTAVCPECLAELFDPHDRRWRYPFINCTHCGPRYTITHKIPYDRAHTSMRVFQFCAQCASEYNDPANRRFHAEPSACPRCGPALRFHAQPQAHPSPGDPMNLALQALQQGQIVALKGLGGFHLACDARQAAVVQRLRTRKHRDEKPFALMVANVASLAPWAELDDTAQALLESPSRPIVLLRKKPGFEARFPGVAPGLAWVGVILPYTPLHWLLFHQALGCPGATHWMSQPQELTLVMTSANPGGAPLVFDNRQALETLTGIADCWLLHERDIVVPCDDSVVVPCPAPAQPSSQPGFYFIRRARGYTPLALPLAQESEPVLALGGQLKNTLCITRGREAFVSQHGGDLDHPQACRQLRETVAHLLAILDVQPRLLVHDLHPQFYSTQHALELAARWQVPTLAVQHHQAHVAALVAEHQVQEPVLGLALDGYGLGLDQGAWGGELLQLQGTQVRRLAHLTPLALPGLDRAALEPWRMGAAALQAMGRGSEIPGRFAQQPQAAQLAHYLAHARQVPHTTSMGRWFDAAAGLLGVRQITRFEGQAAMLLEGLSEDQEPGHKPAVPPWRITPQGSLDLLPLLQELAAETQAQRGAARFHQCLAWALCDWVLHFVQQTGLRCVALGGGCFLNRVLTRRLRALLEQQGLSVLTAQQVPPNDGGLSLGQAWIGQHHLRAAGA